MAIDFGPGIILGGGINVGEGFPAFGTKAIFGFGQLGSGAATNITNLVSNTGVVAGDVTTVAAAKYI